MSGNCCGIRMGPKSKSRSSSHILKAQDLKATNDDMNSTFLDLNLFDFTNPEVLAENRKKLVRKQSEENVLDNDRKKSIENAIVSKFDPENLKKFLEQDIKKIRSKNIVFEDSHFIKYITSIVENTESQLYLSLKSRLRCKDLKDLNKTIKWERTQVHNFSFLY